MVEAERAVEAAATVVPVASATVVPPAPTAEDALVSRLKNVHQRLAGTSYKDGVSAEDRRSLVEALTVAGRTIESGAGRDWLRNALFFWVSEQASHGERERFAPAPTLDEYTGASPPEAVLARLDPIVEAPPAPVAASPEPGNGHPLVVAPAVLPSGELAPPAAPAVPAAPFVVPSAPTASAVPTPPAEPAPPLRMPAGEAPEAAAVSAGAEPAVPEPAAGSVAPSQPTLIRRGKRSGGAASAEPAAPPPPPLATASDLTDEEARRLVRISALARQWRLTDEANRKGFLIDDRVALLDAYRFTLLDPDIRDLVEASEAQLVANERSAERRGRFLNGLLIVVALLALLMAAFALYALDKRRLAEKNQREIDALKAAEQSKIAIAEKDAVRRKVLAATDALRRQEIKPLVDLLGELGGSDVSDLSLLQVRKPDEKSRYSDSITKLPNRAPQSQQADAPQQDLCVGYLGLGSKGAESRLEGDRDPATVAPGDVVTLDQGADIRLRSGLPDPDSFAFAAQTGVVPAGATIKILGAPVTYTKNLGQVWAQVAVPRTYCTTVYLQYVGNPGSRMEVIKALGDVGVVTPPAQQIPTAKGRAEVRYYWTADRLVAEQVAAALSRFNKGQPLKLVPLLNYPNRPASGIMEVWVDLAS